jgi:multiple sugar transport system substrate-binding protein
VSRRHPDPRGAWTPFTRRAVAAALLCLLALGGAACGKGRDGSAGSVTVTFWQFWPAETVRPLIAAFEAANPGIRVEMQQLTWQSGLEKITAATAAGQPPDLCELGTTWFAKFAANGALADLTADTEAMRSQYLMWDACTYDGKVYALPWVTGTRVLFTNRELARAAGLDPDRPPETWEELLAFARALHRPQDQVYGYGLNAGERYIQFKKFMPFAWGNGGDVLSADHTRCTFAEAPVVEALDFYLRLEPHSLLEKQEVLDQAFKDGRLGAMISGAWLLKTIPRDAPALDFGVALVPRPAIDRGFSASFGGGELLAVFARSPHREAALKLAKFLAEAPQAMAIARAEQSVLPAALTAGDDPFFVENPKQAVFLKQLETAVFPPNLEAWVEIEDVVDAALEKAVFGKEAPRDALSEACRRIDELLARRRR